MKSLSCINVTDASAIFSMREVSFNQSLQGSLKIQKLIEDAKFATEFEHKMTLMQGIRAYPKAMAWSCGFDQVMMFSFYTYPSFLDTFGIISASGVKELPARWQSGYSAGSSSGQIVGLLITGYLTDKLGYRHTMHIGPLFMTGFIFIPFFAQNLPTLLTGQVLLGTITTAYAAEVCPVVLRSYLTTYVNICWKIGNFLSAAVIRGLLYRTDKWGFRIPFALQWMWPIPIVHVAFVAPESPWWLVRCGRNSEAVHSLERLITKGSIDVHKTVAMIEHAVLLEREITQGGTYLDCFRDVDLRRTHISCIAYACQSLCGSQLLRYSTYFFEKGGLSPTICCWFLMQFYGRRTLYLNSFAMLFVVCMVIGILGCVPTSSGISWASGVLLLVLMFTYDIGIGPIVYSVAAEIPSSILRSKTIALARGTYIVGQIVGQVLTPYMLNTTAWNWRQRSGFFWGSTTLLCIVWIFFQLPEPRGLSYAKLDALFAKKVPARKFQTTETNVFDFEISTNVKETVD
ncbi:putative transporter [Dipodascopsis uninucleata]